LYFLLYIGIVYSILQTTYPFLGLRGAGANPSGHWAKAGFTLATSPCQGCHWENMQTSHGRTAQTGSRTRGPLAVRRQCQPLHHRAAIFISNSYLLANSFLHHLCYVSKTFECRTEEERLKMANYNKKCFIENITNS